MQENTQTSTDTQIDNTDYEAFYAEFDDENSEEATDILQTKEDSAKAAGTTVEPIPGDSEPKKENADDTILEKTDEDVQADGGVEMFPGEIKVYGQVQKISMDDAVKAIQLSYAMPKMQEKLTAANTQLEELAKLKGCGSVAEFIEKTKQDTEFGDLIEKYGAYENIPDDILKVHTENTQLRQQSAQAQAAKEQRDKSSAEYDSFMSSHPDVDKIPNEVISMVADGRSNLEGAWSIFQVEKLAAENKSLKQSIEIENKNNKNKQTSTPSVKGSGGQRTDSDIFDIFDE